MHRIDADAATVGGLFTDGDPGTGAQATVLDAKWANAVQEEICTVVETAGLTLNDALANQLLAAIRIEALKAAYQVGDVWVTTSAVLPSLRFGFGTWVKRTGAVYGQTDGDPQFSALGAVGATNHNHSTAGHALTAAENGPHAHGFRDRYMAENNTTLNAAGAVNREFMPANYNNNNAGTNGTDNDNNAFAYYDSTTSSSGTGDPHSHGNTGDSAALPRGRVYYVWERTA